MPDNQYAGIKILAAEENLANQIVIKAFLQQLAIDFELCGNGHQVWDIIKAPSNTYNLILMDCEMPILDGFTTTQ